MAVTPCRCPPLIARLLSDERYFGDSAPNWQKAPTAQYAVQARKGAAKRLRRFAGEFPEAERLADILTRRTAGHRCPVRRLSRTRPGGSLRGWPMPTATRGAARSRSDGHAESRSGKRLL